MRKLTAICFALLIATSAVAAPNDSTDRNLPNPISRVIQKIKTIIRSLDLGQPVPPTPQ